jgi:hypothetical protein
MALVFQPVPVFSFLIHFFFEGKAPFGMPIVAISTFKDAICLAESASLILGYALPCIYYREAFRFSISSDECRSNSYCTDSLLSPFFTFGLWLYLFGPAATRALP